VQFVSKTTSQGNKTEFLKEKEKKKEKEEDCDCSSL